MSETATQDVTFSFIAGDLSLDFTNTVSGWRELHGFDREKLTSYSLLVSWSRQAGILEPPEAERLLREAGRRPEEAEEVRHRAEAVRETIYRIFQAVSSERDPSGADLDQLNAAVADTMGKARLTYSGETGFRWDWATDERALDRMLWPVVRAAADLLVSDSVERVRACSGDTCGWLFVDTSRNHSRRWCDMRDCGNRAKVKRHYHRKRAGDAHTDHV